MKITIIRQLPLDDDPDHWHLRTGRNHLRCVYEGNPAVEITLDGVIRTQILPERVSLQRSREWTHLCSPKRTQLDLWMRTS